MKACISNQLDTMKLLKTLGADIYLQNLDGYTSLDFASSFSSPTIIRYLVKELGFDINSLKEGQTQLQMAIISNSINAALEILRLNVNYHRPNAQGYYPIHTAAKHGNTDMVRYLILNKYASISQTTEQTKLTALEIAAQAGHLQTLQALVKISNDQKISFNNQFLNRTSYLSYPANILMYLASVNQELQMKILDEAIAFCHRPVAVAIFHQDKLSKFYSQFMSHTNKGLAIISAILSQLKPEVHPALLKVLCIDFRCEDQYDILLEWGKIAFPILNKTRNLNYELEAIQESVKFMAPLASLQKSKRDPIFEKLPHDIFNTILSFITPPMMKTSPALIKKVMQQSSLSDEKNINKRLSLFFKKLDRVIPEKKIENNPLIKRKV